MQFFSSLCSVLYATEDILNKQKIFWASLKALILVFDNYAFFPSSCTPAAPRQCQKMQEFPVHSYETGPEPTSTDS